MKIREFKFKFLVFIKMLSMIVCVCSFRVSRAVILGVCWFVNLVKEWVREFVLKE